ncbi:universal stress protein [Octadecabacter sp. 1_MG-2023]|uniref:universal stress protein n=1 Tax=unclassified Octadecabacter TaxID=196158 RepID=UPI001C090187|nr:MULTISPECIES: universal stress protein [unclassified Octadecabacter]MBU2994778.1 universal stress protein [Octadecabacter sp. B2R22]MDO6733928.1 universal stress protein [Octadecabacter sp. 1_MG-2023]
MIKTILCAVDINRPKDEAQVVKEAKKLADLDGAQLDVITVVPDFGANVVSAYFKDHDVKSAQDGAAKLLNEMVADVIGAEANKDVRHLVAVGSVYEEVLKAAKLSKAGLIVIGAHRADFKDYLLGPNAARVVRHSNCSVYVVR